MSIEDRVQNNLEAIQKMQQEVVEALNSTDSGRSVLEKSGSLGATTQMQQMMQIFADPSAHEVDRLSMAKYFGKAMEGNVQVNMQKFIDYLNGLIADPRYQSRAEYFARVKSGVETLRTTSAFNDYMTAYKAFQSDQDLGAVKARNKIEEVSNSMRRLIEDNPQGSDAR